MFQFLEFNNRITMLRIFSKILIVSCSTCGSVFSQVKGPTQLTTSETSAKSKTPPRETEERAENSIIEDPLNSELVEVNWLEELFEGGITMVPLAILSIELVAILIEITDSSSSEIRPSFPGLSGKTIAAVGR